MGYTFSGGDVYFWIEQESSIHRKAFTSSGAPVELSADEARFIALKLNEIADQLDRIDR